MSTRVKPSVIIYGATHLLSVLPSVFETSARHKTDDLLKEINDAHASQELNPVSLINQKSFTTNVFLKIKLIFFEL